MSEEKTSEALYVYVGLRHCRDASYVHAWAGPLEDAEATTQKTEAEFRVFSKPLQKRATPGSVWRLKAGVNGTSFFVEAGEYVGRYSDEDTAARWLVQHHATERERDAEKKAAKELGKRLDLERLAPFREAYHKARGVHRGMVLALVVQEITRGSL